MPATVAALKRAHGLPKPGARPSASDDRSALRLAIENAAAAKRKLEARERVREQANAHIDAAQEKLTTVEAAVARARESHAKKVASALSAGRMPPGPGVMQDARDAVTEAKDQLHAAQSAAEQVRAELPTPRAEVAICENRIVGQANAVIGPAIREWLVRAKQARAEALMCQEVLHALVDDPDLDAGLRDPRLDDVQRFRARAERIAPLAGLLDEVRRFLMNVAGDTDETKAREAAQVWRSYRMRLRTEPDAEMPSRPFR
jgi:hypothetical protein